MPTSICIFEDSQIESLSPLALTRPPFDLRCGIFSLREKILQRMPPSEVTLFCRSYLEQQVQEDNPELAVNKLPAENALLLNGSYLFREALPNVEGPESVWKSNDRIVAARLDSQRSHQLSLDENGLHLDSAIAGIPVEEIEGKFIDYPWDLVLENSTELKGDFNRLARGGKVVGKVHPSAVLLNQSQIHVAASAKVMPGVVLDAENGPIYIDEGATIMAHASLAGPVYIGRDSTVKVGAKIYGGTAIGPVCKVGGEIEESIIHGFSNKQHEGFLGHAYLGEWVNIGADSNNSDLKNNYSSVKVLINGEQVDSGSLFVGLFMGDHAKCGINTMFNSGTVVGVSSNVFGADYQMKYIPSFAWGGRHSSVTYNLNKALDTAARVMQRRNQALTPAREAVLRHVYQATIEERQKYLSKRIKDRKRG